MARRIKLSQIGEFSEDKLNTLVRLVVLETDLSLKQKSPVDTGRFRNSWVIGENSTSNYDGGGSQQPTGAHKNAKKPPTTPNPGPPVYSNYAGGQERVGNTYHVSNNLPYAEPLANGHSQQAPAGWIDLVAREMTRRVRIIADDLGRQD
mgnify:CR=1 FL=1